MTVREYIGARYVPLFMGDWDNTKAYEPLSIVQHEGNSFTSRQYVPVGIEITNGAYWAETGNFNAQVEQYREEVQAITPYVEADKEAIEAEMPTAAGFREKAFLNSGNTDNVTNQYVSLDLTEEGEKRKVYNVTGSRFFNNAINDVCASIALVQEYIKNHDKIYYDSTTGQSFGGFSYTGTYDNPQETTPNADGSGKLAMNCAVFSNLIMQGVPFHYSTYNESNLTHLNLATNPVFPMADKNALAYCMENQETYPNISNTGLFTWKLARYLYDMGVLRPVGDNVFYKSGLGNEATGTFNPGDILFFAAPNESTTENRFLRINHCAVFLGYIGNSDVKTNMLVAECSSNAVDPNRSPLKVRTLRNGTNQDVIVACFTPGYNNGMNLADLGTITIDNNRTSYATDTVISVTNQTCNDSTAPMDINARFAGAMNLDTYWKEHRGAYMLEVEPIYTGAGLNAPTACSWVIQYHNALDSWSNYRLTENEHRLTKVGNFVIPIMYGCEVKIYTTAQAVTEANLYLHICNSDKLL